MIVIYILRGDSVLPACFIGNKFLPSALSANKSKIISREHNIRIKGSLCVIPDYNLLCAKFHPKSSSTF